MFRFFRDRWVSRKEFDEVEKDYKREFDRRHEIAVEFHKKKKELLNIIEEKEKTIQKLELEILEDEKDLLRVSRNFWEKNDELINFANKTGETIEELKLEIERLKSE